MKHWWLIPLIVGAAFALGRLTIKPKVVTETVVEYHSINTSAVAPSIVSEPIGTRKVKVMLRKNLFLNIDHLRDSTKKVDHIEDKLEMVEGLSNGCLMGLSNSQPVTNCNGLDSATVELPIRDYTFTDDSTYTIVARGVYVESLPQIQLYPKTTSATRIESASAPKVTHGIQMGGGIAYTPKGFQPAVYFGYGLNIRF